MDEALWLPTEKSVRVALRTQQIIAYEFRRSGFDRSAGGFVSDRTADRRDRKRRARLHRQRSTRWAARCNPLNADYMQNEIQNAAYAAQQEIERKEQIVVGVNQFAVDEVLTLERLKVDPCD